MRLFWIIAAVVIAGLTAGSAATLVIIAHDKPLHHAFACEFARDFRQEVHLPPAPCHDPGRPCMFDGGGVKASGTTTTTDTGHWFCADGTLYKVNPDGTLYLSRTGGTLHITEVRTP